MHDLKPTSGGIDPSHSMNLPVLLNFFLKKEKSVLLFGIRIEHVLQPDVGENGHNMMVSNEFVLMIPATVTVVKDNTR